MKLLTVIGARPQFIKAAAVSRVVAKHKDCREVLVHTGQHYDHNMSDVFFQELGIPTPTHSLDIGSGNHGAQTGRMLEQLERVMLDEKPDVVLVYGDTNSTLAGGLAAAKLHLPVAHVEAGLRSFNRRMPEEINRVVTDTLSTWLFAPTAASVSNLRREGYSPSTIHLVGDVMYDAAKFFQARSRAESSILERLNLSPGGYVLATLHRAENTDDADRLAAIVEGILRVAREVPVVLPLHPRTRKCCETEGLFKDLPASLHLIEPVGYLDMARLECDAKVIATDSGGVQKEAFFARVPCVTLRDETEWVELVELGWNKLCPPRSASDISAAIFASVDAKGREGNPYGTGKTSELIVDTLLRQ